MTKFLPHICKIFVIYLYFVINSTCSLTDTIIHNIRSDVLQIFYIVLICFLDFFTHFTDNLVNKFFLFDFNNIFGIFCKFLSDVQYFIKNKKLVHTTRQTHTHTRTVLARLTAGLYCPATSANFSIFHPCK